MRGPESFEFSGDAADLVGVALGVAVFNASYLDAKDILLNHARLWETLRASEGHTCSPMRLGAYGSHSPLKHTLRREVAGVGSSKKSVTMSR